MVTLIDRSETRPRHPEKAHRPDQEMLRKPDWIRVKAPGSPIYRETQQIVRDNAAHPERLIALELGGKNAAIALEDCDLERTARAIAFAAFATTGQRCTSSSRLIATAAIAEPLIGRIAEIARAIRVGHPLDADVFMGPLISREARSRLLAAQSLAESAGIESVVPGGAIEVPGRDGFYVRPALRRAPTAALEIAGYSDEELFGPDLCAMVVPDLDASTVWPAIALALAPFMVFPLHDIDARCVLDVALRFGLRIAFGELG